MSTKAQAILDEIKALPPQGRREVLLGLQQSSMTDDERATGGAKRVHPARARPVRRRRFVGSLAG